MKHIQDYLMIYKKGTKVTPQTQSQKNLKSFIFHTIIVETKKILKPPNFRDLIGQKNYVPVQT